MSTLGIKQFSLKTTLADQEHGATLRQTWHNPFLKSQTTRKKVSFGHGSQGSRVDATSMALYDSTNQIRIQNCGANRRLMVGEARNHSKSR